MSKVLIEYRIQLESGEIKVFKNHLDAETFDLEVKPKPNPPAWTALSFKQCPHCPLDEETHPQCPVALQLYALVSRFENTRSIDPVKLMVITDERRVAQKLDLQHALASLLDLVMPTCGCPKTAYLKPLARFHLPLASEEEHVFRVTGMYLLAQYFLSGGKGSSEAPFTGLSALYKDLHQLNASVVSRLQSVTKSDSVKNAVALIDVYSMLVPLLVDEQLSEMRGFFDAYLPHHEAKADTSYFVEAKSFLLDSEEDGKIPDWLKSVATIKKEPASKEPAAEAEAGPGHEPPQTLDQILSRSTLTLEPIEEKEEDEDEAEQLVTPPPLFNRFGPLPEK